MLSTWQPQMGNFTMPITCAQPATTQPLFDLGLNLAINFNQAEARSVFNASLAAEPDTCPMCWWGLAYAYAPFLNHPIKPAEETAAGLAAASRAAELAATAAGLSAKERGLVEATAVRFPSSPQGNQTAAAIAYADKLAALHAALPGDVDVASFLAEASMLLECDPSGYHFYNPDDGSPTALTAKVDALLRSVLAAAPAHPMANHLFIHLIEPSAPDVNTSALPAAAALAALCANASLEPHAGRIAPDCAGLRRITPDAPDCAGLLQIEPHARLGRAPRVPHPAPSQPVLTATLASRAVRRRGHRCAAPHPHADAHVPPQRPVR